MNRYSKDPENVGTAVKAAAGQHAETVRCVE